MLCSVERLLWAPGCGTGRGPKRSLTLTQIAAATVRIADAHGLDAVSMQRVAADLGVTKMALYRYLPGKAELLALAVEEAVEEPPDLSGIAGGWRPRLETWARLLRDVWQRHPWLPAATVGDRSMGPREVGWIESATATLTGTGLPAQEQLDAVLLLCGLLRTTNSAGAAGTQPWTMSAATGTTLRTLLAQRAGDFPALLALLPDGRVRQPVTETPTLQSSWETGLRLLLDGLQTAMRRHAPSER
jgi:AcrR family transcriptional regulator